MWNNVVLLVTWAFTPRLYFLLLENGIKSTFPKKKKNHGARTYRNYIRKSGLNRRNEKTPTLWRCLLARNLKTNFLMIDVYNFPKYTLKSSLLKVHNGTRILSVVIKARKCLQCIPNSKALTAIANTLLFFVLQWHYIAYRRALSHPKRAQFGIGETSCYHAEGGQQVIFQ